MQMAIRSAAAVVGILLGTMQAGATNYTGKIQRVNFGADSNRVSVFVYTPHTLSCSTANDAYTFSGKPFWTQAMLTALQSDKTIKIVGTNTCTLGVEEIGSFDVIK